MKRSRYRGVTAALVAAVLFAAEARYGAVAQADSCTASDTGCGWTQTVTDPALGEWPGVRHMAADPSGNVYVVGETYPAVANYRHSETLLAKYDAGGKLLWLRRFSGPGADGLNAAYGIAVDVAGNICLGGITDGSYVTPGTPARRKGFAARYDTNGERLWAIDRPIEVFAMVQDGERNCYAASTNEVAKYDQRGALVWSYRQTIRDVAVEPGGVLHLIAIESNAALPSLITLDQQGRETRRISLELGKSIGWAEKGFTRFVLKTDGKGSVYLHASATGLDQQRQPRIETYLARLTPEGQLAWEAHHGRVTERWDSFDLALDNQGNAYLSGVRQAINGQGPRNGFVMKYSASGALQWIRHFDGASKNGAGSISLDAQGNYFIAGGTEGVLEGQPVDRGRRNTPFIARNRPAK